MKKVIILPFLLLSVLAFAQGGLRFDHESNWDEAKKKAISEKKLIFIDFFTEWCGPCLAMAEDVFPLLEVGNLYNANFINLKIDAEKGEGVTLKEKYNVQSYPTFVFIDPKTEEVVHRSSSRQEKEVFIFTGESALDPKKRSGYLEKTYASGGRDNGMVNNYMDYLASMYKRDELKKVVDEYVARKDFSLSKAEDWSVFNKHIGGVNNPVFKEVAVNRDKYVKLYGEKAVDDKLFKEFNFSVDTELLGTTPEFKGKAYLMKKNKAESYIRAKKYEEAAPILAELMANPGEFKTEFCQYLKFVGRSVLYGEHSDFWKKQCAAYTQYVAYNNRERSDAMIHYDYAVMLEKIIRTIPDADKYFPESIVKGTTDGAKSYSMRSPNLKQKPVKGKKK